jgi:hypothetical protein
MGLKQQRVSGSNFMLTGDAANLVDPFTGEGIGNALYSGMLAADACRDALLDDKFDADFLEKKYDDRLFGKIGAEMKTSAFLQRLCHYPWLLRFVVNKAHKSPTLNHAIQSMFTGVNLDELQPSFTPRYYQSLVTALAYIDAIHVLDVFETSLLLPEAWGLLHTIPHGVRVKQTMEYSKFDVWKDAWRVDDPQKVGRRIKTLFSLRAREIN